jgi:hypothetical protein
MKEIREAIVGVAERVTIADLCERYLKLGPEAATPLDFAI